ncbi:MAG: hypothetical protein ACE14P_02800 [Methanotrichaceae archaeon]
MHYKVIATFLLTAVLIGTTGGLTTTSTQFIYKMDQKVTGEGFFSSYQNITTTPIAVPTGSTGGVLALNQRSYGSGSYNVESTTTALNGANTDTSGEYISISERNISFKETVDLAYGEKAFNLGNSFRSGPITALGKEETCVKNYGSGVSMNALFDSASTLSKDLSANLNWKAVESGDSIDPTWDYSLEQKGITKLNVDATFTGKGHIGALEEDNIIDQKSKNHNDNINTLIDEDYLGTYTLSKKMSHEFNYKDTREAAEWLSCCYNGWDTMPAYAKKGFGASAKGVFDCTCYKTQKNAQFLEPDGKKAW